MTYRFKNRVISRHERTIIYYSIHYPWSDDEIHCARFDLIDSGYQWNDTIREYAQNVLDEKREGKK